ncbi:hypothetical protein LSTR_LSTR006584 [Laodelphax striatellus]|uniref:Odorant receptor n=1 Tax=Laodelphax striatellus TaxID=195883 RepID=A0A482WTI2_LAOST|nr:hypothetical protein LSTR_LSTR006584 [Laodelphax striatellus]
MENKVPKMASAAINDSFPEEFEISSQFRRISKMFNTNGIGFHNMRITGHILLVLCCIVNMLMGLHSDWNKVESRILWLRDLQSFLLIQLFFCMLGKRSWTLELFCDLMDEHYSRQHEIGEFCEVNRTFRLANSLNVKTYCRNFLAVLTIRNSAFSYVPMAYSVFLVIAVIIGDNYSQLQQLPIITYFHYPQEYASWQLQFALNIFATYFYVVNTVLGFVFLISNLLILHNTWYQFGLFTEYLRELNRMNLEEARLRYLMNRVIRYHQTILSMHSRYGKLCRMPILIFNFSITFQICTYIYSIIELRKSRFLIQLIFALMLLYAFSSYGQRVVDVGERSSNFLYEIRWTEKPDWYQKHLLLMLTRSANSMELHFFGLMSVKRTLFTKVLQAAYTYFNFLKGTDEGLR